MAKKILLINDMAGYGKVALSAMIPILSYMKYEVFNLPTALVSNTLDYGKFDILDTTEYMKKTIKIWEELGFQFDGISTGFIVSKEQTELITEFCKKKSETGTLIFVDPIMGDDGKLYNGIGKETVSLMQRLVSVADYIVPNYTEASYLTGSPYKEKGATREELYKTIDKLRDLGAKSVIITSAILAENNEHVVVGYDHKKEKYFILPFKEIPVRFPGTGDIFSSVFTGEVMQNKELELAVKKAMNVVEKMIKENIENVDKFKGIPLELYMEMIEK